MKAWTTKVAVLIVFFSFLLAPALSFGGDGNVTIVPDPVANETVCSNGEDDDNDTSVDGDDPGCTKSYHNDFSELDKRDIDATWIFSGKSPPSVGSSPSVFFGATVNKSGKNMFYWDNARAGDFLDEGYLRNSNSTWAGGIAKTLILNLDSNTNITWGGTPFAGAEIIGSAAQDEPDKNKCGNARRDNGEGNFNCPSDTGLPDDRPQGVSTLNQSSQTMTETVGELSIEDFQVTTNSESADEVSDRFEFRPIGGGGGDLSLDAFEYWGGKSVDLTNGGDSVYTESKLQDDVSSADEETTVGSASNYLVRIEDSDSGRTAHWEENPDYFLKEEPPTSEVWAVYVKKKDSLSSFGSGSVTSYVLEDEQQKKIYGGGTTYTDVDCRELDENATCKNPTEYTGCKNPSAETSYQFSRSDSTQTTLTQQTQHLETSYNRPGYDDVSSSSPHDVTVDHYDQAPSDTTDYQTCTGSSTTTVQTDYVCDTSDGPSAGCEETTQSTTITTSTGQVTKYWGYGTRTVNFKFEDLTLKETKVFDVNPDENVNGAPDPIEVLFTGDNYEDYSVPGDIVYNSNGSWAFFSPKSGGEPSNNSNSVSRSRFQIMIDQDGEFISNRTSYSTFDVDGKGQGIGFVSVNDRRGGQVIGWELTLVRSERFSGDYSGGGFIDAGDIDATGSCPRNHFYCVGTAKTGLKNLNNWGSLDPASGIEFSDVKNEKAVNESFSTCRLFQFLRKQANSDPTPLRCQYDHEMDFPRGPTPMFKPTEKPFLVND